MSDALSLLQEGRRRELAQALFYRLLAADAEQGGDGPVAERLYDLLADEQHHVSRLTARILELGGKPADGATGSPLVPPLAEWEGEARRREADEVAWYDAALGRADDAHTKAVLREILASERRHLDHLAGKWMPAGPTEGEGST